MATTALSRRKGTLTQHATFTGVNGEITVVVDDTGKAISLRLHDGVTPGGKEITSNTTSTTIDSFADLLTSTLTDDVLVSTRGYYAGEPGVGSAVYYKTGVTGTPGATDGGSYFVDTDGKRWEIVPVNNQVTFTQFGAKGVTELAQGQVYTEDYTTNWQAFLDYTSANGVEGRIDPLVFPIKTGLLEDAKTLTLVGTFGKSKLILVDQSQNTNILQINNGDRVYLAGITFDGNQGGMGPTVGGGLVQINDNDDRGLISFVHRCEIKSVWASTTSNGLATTGDKHVHHVSETRFNNTRSSGWYPQSFFSSAYKCIWDTCRTAVSFVNTKHLEIVSSKFVGTEQRDLLSFSQTSSKSAAERLILRNNEFDRRGNTDPITLEISKRNMRSTVEEFGVGSKYGVWIEDNKFLWDGASTTVDYFMILGSSDSSDPNFDGYTLQDVYIEGNEFNGVRPARVYRTNNITFRRNKILNTNVGLRLENGCDNVYVENNEMNGFDSSARLIDMIAGASYDKINLLDNKYDNCATPFAFQGGNPTAVTNSRLVIPRYGCTDPMADKSQVIWWDIIDNVKKLTVDAPADGYVIDFEGLGRPDYLILKPSVKITLGNPAGAFELYDYQTRYIVNDGTDDILVPHQGAGGFTVPNGGTVLLRPGDVLQYTVPDTAQSSNATYAVLGAKNILTGRKLVGDFSSHTVTLDDFKQQVTLTRSSTAPTITCPSNAPVRFEFDYINIGTQTTTIAAPAGDTMLGTTTVAANTIKTIVKVSDTQWSIK